MRWLLCNPRPGEDSVGLEAWQLTENEKLEQYDSSNSYGFFVALDVRIL